MNYSEVYRLPIRYRHWYLSRLAKHIDRKNKVLEEHRSNTPVNNLDNLNKFEARISKKFDK